MDELETNKFVLVHGGGFGAWCWYKTIALLEQGGLKVTAIDLTGSGTDSFNSNNVMNLSHYVRPLTSFLEKLGDGEKVGCLSQIYSHRFLLEDIPSLSWQLLQTAPL